MGCSVSSLEEMVHTTHKSKLLIFDPPVTKDAIKLSIVATRTTAETVGVKFDPRLPLTVRQKFNIMKSWKGIARNIEGTGILMFLRLFETNEEVRSMFTKLVHNGQYDISQLRENKALENHVKQVMYTLDEVISSLDDVDVVVDTLSEVAKGHRKLKSAGFNPNVFWKIKEPFLLAVRETLGDRYSANMEHIYRKTIKFIIETLIEGFNKEQICTNKHVTREICDI